MKVTNVEVRPDERVISNFSGHKAFRDMYSFVIDA